MVFELGKGDKVVYSGKERELAMYSLYGWLTTWINNCMVGLRGSDVWFVTGLDGHDKCNSLQWDLSC